MEDKTHSTPGGACHATDARGESPRRIRIEHWIGRYCAGQMRVAKVICTSSPSNASGKDGPKNCNPRIVGGATVAGPIDPSAFPTSTNIPTFPSAVTFCHLKGTVMLQIPERPVTATRRVAT